MRLRDGDLLGYGGQPIKRGRRRAKNAQEAIKNEID